MTVATGVKATDGRHYQLEFCTGDNYVTAWIKLNRRPVGCAKLLLHESIAELADIQIFNRVPILSRLFQTFPLSLFAKDFRCRGIGSLFLSAVCDHLRNSGISRIEGTMSGDIERLTRWYRRAGFEVDHVSKAISKVLVVPN